ncbi:hypothetical protein IFT68_15840 [Oxalobacteraceae sp. CFBP 13730]|nr:hypothetical protein [Oxalobacteraceae sp. CFBP 13730]
MAATLDRGEHAPQRTQAKHGNQPRQRPMAAQELRHGAPTSLQTRRFGLECFIK